MALKISFLAFVIFSMSYLLRTRGDSNSINIIGGENAAQGEFPYMIAVNPDMFNFSYCGGALIEEKGVQLVLTSAKCAEPFMKPGFDLSSVRLVGGDIALRENDASGREQIRRLKKVFPHPDYEPNGKANDIAILSLETDFEINEDVSPIPLPSQGQVTNGDVILTGFGGNKTFESGQLDKIQLSLLNQMDCIVLYGKSVFQNEGEGKLCAKSRGIDGPNHCGEDLGSPIKAVDGGYLVGIVIFPESCRRNLPCLPDVYTDVAFHVDWILQTASIIAKDRSY